MFHKVVEGTNGIRSYMSQLFYIIQRGLQIISACTSIGYDLNHNYEDKVLMLFHRFYTVLHMQLCHFMTYMSVVHRRVSEIHTQSMH